MSFGRMQASLLHFGAVDWSGTVSAQNRHQGSGGVYVGTQSNLATSYAMIGRHEEALRIRRDVYSGRLKLNGEENLKTLLAANNYAASLKDLSRFEEAKSLMRKTIPVARQVLGEGHDITFRVRTIYAQAIYKDPAATLDDLREAVTTLEESSQTARRVLGGAHPVTGSIEHSLKIVRSKLAAFAAP